MANWYVRTGGNDSTGNGTSSGTAWATVGKALSSGAGPAGGDTIWVGAGTYRQLVTCALTSPTSELKIIGDLDGSQTGDAGVVILSAFTGGDNAAVATTAATLTLSGKSNLTFQNLWIVGADIGPNCVNGNTATSTGITFRNCFFTGPGNSVARDMTAFTNAAGVAFNLLFDRCFWAMNTGGQGCLVTAANSATASDYDVGVTVQNGFALVSGSNLVRGTSTLGGGSTGKPGGIKILNCTTFGVGCLSITTGTGAGWSTGTPAVAYNNVVFSIGNVPFGAAAANQITEDWNHVVSTAARSNVTAGANDGAGTSLACLLNLGQEWMFGLLPRPFGTPWYGFGSTGFSLNWGTSGTVSLATDLLGRPRPAGGVSKAAGALERHDTGVRATTPVHGSTAHSLQLSGPSDHEFRLPVDAVAQAPSVWAQYDASYGAGTKPQMILTGGGEIGVADQTVTFASDPGSGAWGQIAFSSFTPTAQGFVTIRFVGTAASGGNAYFGDFTP